MSLLQQSVTISPNNFRFHYLVSPFLADLLAILCPNPMTWFNKSLSSLALSFFLALDWCPYYSDQEPQRLEGKKMVPGCSRSWNMVISLKCSKSLILHNNLNITIVQITGRFPVRGGDLQFSIRDIRSLYRSNGMVSSSLIILFIICVIK